MQIQPRGLSAKGAAPFETFGPGYRAQGLLAFPCDGKVPVVSGFNRWTGLSLSTIGTWVRCWPDANIGLGTRRAGLAVLDADHPDAPKRFLATAGETPLIVRTPRGGEHWYFRDRRGVFKGARVPNFYDVKAAGGGDLVLLPGSYSEARRAFYTLDGDPVCNVPEAFAALLRQIPDLSDSAHCELTRTPSGRTTVAMPGGVSARIAPARPREAPSELVVMDPASRTREGARNVTLFRWCCIEAHRVKAECGSGENALGELRGRALALNATFLPPLQDAEVEKTAASAWRSTIRGVNRPCKAPARPVRATMIELGGQARALALLAFLSDRPDGREVELSPLAWSRDNVIPGWTRNDYRKAVATLTKAGRVAVNRPGAKGSGNASAYVVMRPLVSSLCPSRTLASLNGDADAAALLLALVERWGVAYGRVTVSPHGMTETARSPFYRWTAKRLLKARRILETAGYLTRVELPRRTIKAPPATFSLGAADVLKMVGIVPGTIHPRLGDDRD